MVKSEVIFEYRQIHNGRIYLPLLQGMRSLKEAKMITVVDPTDSQGEGIPKMGEMLSHILANFSKKDHKIEKQLVLVPNPPMDRPHHYSLS